MLNIEQHCHTPAESALFETGRLASSVVELVLVQPVQPVLVLERPVLAPGLVLAPALVLVLVLEPVLEPVPAQHVQDTLFA